MASLLRTTLRISRPRVSANPAAQLTSRRWNGDYGSKQSGHEQGVDQKNPMKHMEHPGPESPASKGKDNPRPSSGSGSSQPSNTSSQSSSTSHAEPSNGAQPKIHKPKLPDGDESADVKKHNEEMESRSDRSVNQIGQDGKVDKNFWKGDVGAGKTNKK